MTYAPEALLVGAVVGVGILHTIVPDHWVPITLIARQQGWSRGETARAALKAGTGHVLSTLLIGLLVWIAGVAFATKFGTYVSVASSLALVAFGGWIALASLRELRLGQGHGHSHDRGLGHGHEPVAEHGPHGSERNTISTPAGAVSLSIFERGTPPRFRVTGPEFGSIAVETVRDNGVREMFTLRNLGPYWESEDTIPEPHEFSAALTVTVAGRTERYTTRFAEHPHDDDEQGHGHDGHGHGHDDDHADALYVPEPGMAVALTHSHLHRHGSGRPHSHRHDHDGATWHRQIVDDATEPPLHEHRHKTSTRTALLLILGSSPMVEGIPAFFAAGKYGPALIAVMAIAFGISTIATYVVLCVYSTAGLQRLKLGSFERYGEVISGAFIALVGLVFLFVPVF